MNKTLLSVLICTVALAGCKKDESDTPSNTGSNQQANQTAAKQNEGTVQLGTSGNADRTRNISVGTGGGSANSNNNPGVANGSNPGNNANNNNASNNNNGNNNNGNNNVKTVSLKEAAGDVPGYGRGFYRYGKDPSQITDADLEKAYRWLPPDVYAGRLISMAESGFAPVGGGGVGSGLI